ncbi:MAG: RnfABCDGE type electron transport complex subunit B [Oscillospiraceae bacterium]|jgi:RnfABCDGE-type electron transport complex B subunit|nr:RnfABCDGE type electron transport complex subunit B [Oscillospiraceae bacterium]
MLPEILYPFISIGALALCFGALLGFSAKKFAVVPNEKAERIKGILPGANCAACGYAGCAAFALAVAEEPGIYTYTTCPVGGPDTAAAIARVLGVEAAAANRCAAFIKCNGKDENVKRNYIYDGPKSCIAASQLATGGNKSCAYSCIGLASCKNACPFDAIRIVDSIAVVNPKKCMACGKCVAVCPKKLIEIVPNKNRVRVLCNSGDTSKLVRANCRAGCIGCTLCQKACEAGAITVKDNIAHIDYEKCTLCNKCAQKCPAKAIIGA